MAGFDVLFRPLRSFTNATHRCTLVENWLGHAILSAGSVLATHSIKECDRSCSHETGPHSTVRSCGQGNHRETCTARFRSVPGVETSYTATLILSGSANPERDDSGVIWISRAGWRESSALSVTGQ